MTENGSVEEHLDVPCDPSANFGSPPEARGIVSDDDRSWPWQATPRRSPLELAGQTGDAVAFGLASSLEGLHQLTAMLCSGLPEETSCKAVWICDSVERCLLTVLNSDGQYIQHFVRTNDGIKATHDLYVLPKTYHKRGHARRLMQNLMLVYDNLQIHTVSVYADHEVGGYTWAKLGARPFDAVEQRGLLLDKLKKNAAIWGIPSEYQELIVDEINSAPNNELMYRTAALAGPNDVRFGKLLLLGHKWDGYWDLHDVILRSYLRDALQ